MKTIIALLILVVSLSSFGQTIVITEGGTYTGKWQSLDSNIPAVKIQTKEPVIIEHSEIKGAGELILSTATGANVTVRNTKGIGLTPSIDGRGRGRFVALENFANVVIENNELDHTSGIYLASYRGDKTSGNSIKIRYNKVRNIDGRDRYGKEVARKVQFVQLNTCLHIPGIEIAWNQVTNEYGESRVEDVINIFRSAGTVDSPLRIHHNMIDGAYNVPGSASFSGGGITIDGSWDRTTLETTAYVEAYNNHVIRTTNSGMSITGGNNNKYYNNRIVSSNVTSTGVKIITGGNNGLQMWNYGKAPVNVFHSNKIYDNVVGYMQQDDTPNRKDWWLPGTYNYVNGIALTNNPIKIDGKFIPITREMEDAEIELWETEVRINNIKIGIITKLTALEEIKSLVPGSESATTLLEVLNIIRKESKETGIAEGILEGILKGKDLRDKELIEFLSK